MAYGIDAPWGLKPVMYLSGAPYTGATRTYPIADGYATAIYKYDPVISLSDGTIGIGVAGSAARGVFMGVKYTLSTGVYTFSPNWIASTNLLGTTNTAEAMIADDPDLVFDVQETDSTAGGAAGTGLLLADVNLNINFVVRAGNTTTGISAVSINNESEATTATLNLKILGLTPNETNKAATTTVSFRNWLCAWNTHELKSVGTAGL